jgi:hypothetical protein
MRARTSFFRCIFAAAARGAPKPPLCAYPAKKAGSHFARLFSTFYTSLCLTELGAQRRAVHAEHVRCLRLVAFGARHDRRQQRALDVPDDHVVDARGRLAVEALEVFLERAVDALADFVACR